eukprot:COSAG01_NODE_71192_length_252_cov_1.343949_2_plen_30_part_01
MSSQKHEFQKAFHQFVAHNIHIVCSLEMSM